MVDSQSDSNNKEMVNLFNCRLKESNLDGIIKNIHDKLTQWREESIKTIDNIYQKKLNEVNNYINEIKTNYEEKRLKIQKTMSELNDQEKKNEENADLIKEMQNSIEKDLSIIENLSIEINVRPLTIDDNCISIEKPVVCENISDNYSKFSYSQESSSAIACNQQYLLMHQHPYLSLIGRDSKIIKQNIWDFGWIRDMCWSSTLSCFILITTNDIYCVNEQLEYSPMINENIKRIWFSCTCSDKSLYLSTCQWGSSIFEFNLSSFDQLINEWKPPTTCNSHEGINDIKYNNETIALMIKDPNEHKKRMELKSTKTFETIWSLPLSIGQNIRLFTCCSINQNEWLVIDGTNLHIYHITKDGNFCGNILYNSVPYRAQLFGSNLLAIASEHNLNLHQI